MASANKPFRRVTSLFKKKETPYQTWEDEDSLCEVDVGPPEPKPVVQFQKDYALEATDIHSDSEHSATASCIPSREKLLECFYLGSYEMTGLSIKGRGCIDNPAGHIWEQTQANDKQKPRRKNSWSSKQTYDPNTTTSNTALRFNPRYVKMVAGTNELEVYNNSNGELIIDFKYKTISFVGTHPKYTRLFAFIAQTSGRSPSAFCHAFKCEDKESAKKIACALSDVFQRKIEELQAKKQKIEVTSSLTVVN